MNVHWVNLQYCTIIIRMMLLKCDLERIGMRLCQKQCRCQIIRFFKIYYVRYGSDNINIKQLNSLSCHTDCVCVCVLV